MRTLILTAAVILGCSGGSEQRPAEEPEAPSEGAESDGFSPEQQKELDELLGTDGKAGASAAPSP